MEHIINFFKHPIDLAIIATALTFLYLYRENDKEYKKDPGQPRKSVGYGLPICIGFITFIIASFYFKPNLLFSNQPMPAEPIDVVNNVQIPVITQIPINNQPNINYNQSNINYIPSQSNINSAPIRQVQQNINPVPIQTNINPVTPIKIQSGGSDKIYHFIGKNNIKLPQTDVFIDIAKF